MADTRVSYLSLKDKACVYYRNSVVFGWPCTILLILLICHVFVVSAEAGRSDRVNPQQNTELLTEDAYVPGEILVLLASESNQDEDSVAIENFLRAKLAISGKVLRRIRLSRHRRVLRIKLPTGKSVEKALSENWKEKDSSIIAVEPNFRVRMLGTPNDSLLQAMWSLNNTGLTGGTPGVDIDAIAAWDITTGSPSVTVAVIDTGIDYLHPDLIDNMWVNTAEIANNGIDDDGNGYIDDVYGYDFAQNDGDPRDENGHGTHTAGTIAGTGNNGFGITGVNWQCKLMACRFLDANGSGSITDAVDAINYAVANGADILSNSWGGGGYSEVLKAAIVNARDQGVLFVAAAGNSGTSNDATPHYPSNYDVSNVISVAATDHNDELAGFSCYGSRTVHLGAPGVRILSSVLNGAYDFYSGTSMATPHVSGVAALLLANDPELSLQELKSRIIWTGEPILSLDGKTVSGRRLNAYNALTAPDSLEIISPQSDDIYVHGFTYDITWVSIGGNASVDIYLFKDGNFYASLADNYVNEGVFRWDVSGNLAAGSDYQILIDDGINARESLIFEITDERTDYSTEFFVRRQYPFDLSNMSLKLMPDGSSNYSGYVKAITELPTDPRGSIQMVLGDDAWQEVILANNSILFYGDSYSRFYVGSNGYITFDSGDSDYSENFEDHFNMKRISGLFHDLDPSSGGSISCKELADRIVVTWENVREYGRRNSNTFQIEMFFDGQINLSWLGLDAEGGLVGLSEGFGVPIDFQETDISECPQWEPELDFIQISGPAQVTENSDAQYMCMAHYSDGSTEDISVSEKVTWSENSDYADIDSIGYITTEDVNSFHQCTITASYEGQSDTQDIIIKGVDTAMVSLYKCTIKAGKIGGEDSIKCSGATEITTDDIASSDKINIRIWSTNNYLVYEDSLSIDINKIRGDKYRYKTAKKDKGRINSFVVDTKKEMFTLSATGIDLTGLSCPFFVEIGLGDTMTLAKADEEVVNGRRPIPIALMSGVDDTLYVDTLKSKKRKKYYTDSLLVKGSFSLKSEVDTISDIIVNFGGQDFTVQESDIRYQGDAAICKNIDVGNGIVSAKLDLANQTFKIIIKQTSITQTSIAMNFGLAFGNFSEVKAVNLR